jgi:hypothetical protein
MCGNFFMRRRIFPIKKNSEKIAYERQDALLARESRFSTKTTKQRVTYAGWPF